MAIEPMILPPGRGPISTEALYELLIMWATIIWCVVIAWPVYKWVAVAQEPSFGEQVRPMCVLLSRTTLNFSESDLDLCAWATMSLHFDHG
jgi:hypothetical protein